MAQLAIAAFLVGAVFGMRFRVMVLLPATMALGALALALALLAQLSLLGALALFAAAALALQAGYVFGSIGRFVVASTRASRVFGRTLNTAR